MITVTLQKGLARSLRRGHPWIYRDALRAPPDVPSGQLVVVRQRDGRALVWGYWDAESPIAVRVLGQAPVTGVQEVVRERTAAALARRRAALDPAVTNTFRWLHGEADGLPGVHADLYDDVVALRYDGAGARAYYRDLPTILGELGGLREVVDRQQRTADLTVTVRENGVRFQVDLALGQKGGLFLDQRENRAEVGRRARGKTVLNLFGYTGGFSLYAAAGGATATDTVDAAGPAIEAAGRNFELNGWPPGGLHKADAFEFLTKAARTGRRWDLVISDPPSFAPKKEALSAARQAYRRLHRLAASVVAEDGWFFPASCSSHLGRDAFLESVESGVRDAGRRFDLEELRGAGLDHPTLPIFPEGHYLKFAIGRVRSLSSAR